MLNPQQGKEILAILLGGSNDYAELFLEQSESYLFDNFNNLRFKPNHTTTSGTGVRIWQGKEYVYYAIDSLEYEDIKAKAQEIVNQDELKEIEFTKQEGQFLENDFGSWTLSKIKNQLNEYVKEIKASDPQVKIGEAKVSIMSSNRLIINSDGKYLKKTNFYITLIFIAKAQKGEQLEQGFAQISKQLTVKDGMEFFNQKEIYQPLIKKAVSLAVKLLTAPKIKGGKMPVVIGKGGGGVLFHEAVGHSLETSSIAKKLSPFHDKLNQKVASEIVSLVDDGTIEGARGTALFDDEGVPNERRVLIENGVLKNFLVDKFYGNVLANYRPNGAGRRESFKYPNVSRMSNTFIENGTSEFADLFKNIKYGFYAKAFAGGQVNPFTGQFNFGVSEGYVIKDGKIDHLVKGATLIGEGQEVLKNIEMIANDLRIDSSGFCGAESGLVPVAIGQPSLKVSEMIVGGGE